MTRIHNLFFVLALLPLTACDETSTELAGAHDANGPDTGTPDAARPYGGSDAALADTGTQDVVLSNGGTDATPADTSAQDAALPNGGVDGAPADAGTHDAVASDSGADASMVDTSTHDAALPDGADAALADTNMPDGGAHAEAGLPDAGPCSLAPVELTSAASFVVLAGSTITSVGLTTVTGNLGVSPGTAVNGFPPGTISGGAQYAGDATADQAIADLTIAYDDAAARTLCPITVAGNVGGQTLAPGLYKSTSSLEVSSGDLTLDARGDGNAVWIFQIASTLTTTPGRQVILSGGAKSNNVFWQVGTSATLDTTSAFQGTIMADQAVTMNTGATLNGRVLARIAAVSLDTNTIVKPTP